MNKKNEEFIFTFYFKELKNDLKNETVIVAFAKVWTLY